MVAKAFERDFRVPKTRILVLGLWCVTSWNHVTPPFVPEATAVPLLRRVLAASKDERKPCEDTPRLVLAEALECIINGLVYVDGAPCTDPASPTTASNLVILHHSKGDIKMLPKTEWYLKFFKPRGVISANSPDKNSQKPITADFFPGAPSSLHHAGRLDGESEGILLLTTDGHFTYFVTCPGKDFEKEYIALTNCAKDNKPPSTACLQSLLDGIVLPNGHVARAKYAEVADFDGRFARMRIVVTEGRFRMVRQMLRGVGYSCMQLLRVRTCGIGDAILRPALLQDAANEAREKSKPSVKPARLAENSMQLHPGEFAPLTPEEVGRIYADALKLKHCQTFGT